MPLTESQKKCQSEWREKQRRDNHEWWKEYRGKIETSYAMRNPLKRKAKDALNHMIRWGKMKRGVCLVCGDSSVEAHHSDYSKPYNVYWLCRTHHKGIHSAKNRLDRVGQDLPH